MFLEALVLHVFAAFGFAYVVGFAKITLSGREWLGSQQGWAGRWVVNLLECPACLGFWFGIGATFLGHGLLVDPLHDVNAAALGFFTCGTNFLLARWTGLILDEGDSK